MITVKEREKEIERLKENIENHIENIKKLDGEIKEDKKQFEDNNGKYIKMIVDGETENADKFYTKIEQLKCKITAKENRLKIMQETKVKVIKENGLKIAEISGDYSLSYQQEYEYLIDEYKKQFEVMKNIKDKIEEINKISIYKSTMDSRYLDSLIRENDIQRVYFNGYINITKPFYIND